jgi:hypothetical protein
MAHASTMAAAIDGAGGHGHLLETMIVRTVPAGSRDRCPLLRLYI